MYKSLLTYSSFVIACLVTIVAFVTATTYTQLAIAVALYPILVFFACKAFPHRPKNDTAPVTPIIPTTHIIKEEVQQQETPTRNAVGISDIDKRVFLKLIGGTGITLFLFSLFNRRPDEFLTKHLPGKVSLENIDGKKVDPAQSHPMDGYRISEIDDGDVLYHGFINKEGAWFIMKGDTETGSFRYSRGNTNFVSNWSHRENLSYDYFNNIFN